MSAPTPDEMKALVAEARSLTPAGRTSFTSHERMMHRLADALEAVYDAGRRELADRFANQDATRRAAIEELTAWEEQG